MKGTERFLLKSSFAIQRLSDVFYQTMGRPEALPKRYVEYLLLLHSIVRASPSLLDEAQRVCIERGNQRLGDYFAMHRDEEIGHDKWLLDDLSVLGISAERTRVLPDSAIAAMVGSQYYWLKHHHPTMLLGYILVLEGYPIGEAVINEWQIAGNYPANAFTTMRKHSRIDVLHRAELFKLLEVESNIPFDDLFISVASTCEFCSLAFKNLLHPSKSPWPIFT